MMVNFEHYSKVVDEAMALAKRKNADYSGDKVDNLALTGVNGIAVRLLDKVSRAYNLSSGADRQVKDESLRDTFVDIFNYAVFAVIMLDGEWNGGRADVKKEIKFNPEKG